MVILLVANFVFPLFNVVQVVYSSTINVFFAENSFLLLLGIE